jgi:hypothetical protein
MTAHGWKDASAEESQIRAWWTKTPDANIGIACNPSNLCVLDVDHGLADEDDLCEWLKESGLEPSYAVRTGRRPEFGVQLYFDGTIPDVGLWRLSRCEGQVKSLGGYVMAAGSVHPDSKAEYAAIWDIPLLPTPAEVRALKKPTSPSVADDSGPITENRNVTLTSLAGKLRNAGLNREAIEAALLQVNADRCIPPMDDEEVQNIAKHAAEWTIPEPDPIAVIGETKPEPPKDWRTRYHTFEELENAPAISFLIQGFLAVGSITALAAPVGQRKSLIALNVAHALCTGEPLFDQFTVGRKPERVIYLCPEMGLSSFSDRLKKIGLLPCVGNTLFCRTMSAEGLLCLNDLGEELDGAVVIIDTAVRYLKGDENSSEHMRAFAESIFRLMRCGALSVLLLHHSAKGTKESFELTLENAMRGSGELGAFVSCCWATRLQDPTEPYKSASFVTNVKQRDFESKPFDVTCGPDCRLHIVSAPGDAVLSRRSPGVRSDRDGKEDEALAIIREHPEASARTLVSMLADAGVKRGLAWVSGKRADIKARGCSLS